MPLYRMGRSLFALGLLPLTGCGVVALVGSSVDMLRRNSGVSVRGEVVDEAGRPLDDVRVGIQKMRIARPTTSLFEPTPMVSRHETRIVHRRFRLSFPAQAFVFLSFEKPGYCQHALDVESTSRRVGRSPPLPSPAVAPLLSDARHSDKRSVRVVLEKLHKPTRLLAWWQVTLSFGKGSRGTGGTAVDFDRRPGSNPPATKVDDLYDPAQLPARGAYVLAATVGGEPGARLDTFPIRTPGGSNWTSPRQVRLVICGDEQSGFIPVPSPPGIDVLRGMKAAPVCGYERELVLDQDELRTMSTAGGFTAHFYFRCGDRYGKGRLGIPTASPDVVRVDAYFYLQPDGSRNLEAPGEL